MKTKDRIKEEIGLNKVLLTIFSAIVVSLAAYLYKGRNDISNAEFFITLLVFIIFLVFAIFLYKTTISKIKELDLYD